MALFRSLGDPARLAILHRLASGKARVVNLAGLVSLVGFGLDSGIESAAAVLVP